MSAEMVLRRTGRLVALAVLLLAVVVGFGRPAAASPASEWRLDFIIVSVDPDAPLELYNPQGAPGERLTERVKGVVLNGLLDATNGYFSGNRPVVLLAVVRRFDGLSTGATVLAGGEMRATIDVWFADAETTEELTPVRTLEVSRVTLGNIGGIFAHFIGGSQTTRYSRSVANKAREWLAGLDTLAALGPDGPAPAAELLSPVPAPRAVPEPVAAVPAAPVVAPEPVPEPAPAVVERSPVGGIGPAVVSDPVVIAAAPVPDAVPDPVPAAEPEAEVPTLLEELFGEPETAAVEVPEPAPLPVAAPDPVPVPEPASPALAEVVPEPVPAPAAPEPEPEVIAAVDPGAAVSETPATPRVTITAPAEGGPTLANARWVGFSPAVYGGGETEGGLWIAGPFDRDQREGWITDTATGSTTRVTFIWRDPASGGPQATLSQEAAAALGLVPGQVANVAVYLPR